MEHRQRARTPGSGRNVLAFQLGLHRDASLAPEHLRLATREPDRLCDRISNAGAIFLGHWSPVALGDNAADPSHVLPTSGTARWASGLSANDFLHRSSILSFTPEGLRGLADPVRVLAGKEGLTGHATSVEVRLAERDTRTEN